MLCKNVQCLEHIDVSHCTALTQQAIGAISFYCRGLNTLRVAGCPEVRRINTLEVFYRRALNRICCCQDDGSGDAHPDERVSVPARTRRERLRPSHRLHSGLFAQELPLALLGQDGALQRHLQVKHALRAFTLDLM